jgi:hypothetical protein
MLIFTETQKRFRSDLARQAKPIRAESRPLTGHPLPFIIIITDAKVFLKVLLCVLQIVLRLGRDHSEQSAKGPVSFCSISKQSDRQKLVHSRHENEPVHVP